MVPTIKRKFLNLQIDDEASSSSSSSFEVAAPPKKLKVSTRRRTKSLTKIYKETATGKKFYSDPQALNYLGVSASSNSNKRKVKVVPTKEQVSTLSRTPSERPPKILPSFTTTSSSTSQPENKRPALSISGVTFTTPDWLPDGWSAVVLAKATGQKYKVYKETATGKKFYSKPQVLNYLGIADSSSSNNKKVKVAPPKKKQVSTLSTTPSEIPKRLYDLIQDAAIARKSLQLNSNRSAKRKLKDIEYAIDRASAYFKYISEELPIDWEYDPETSFMAHVPKGPTPPKPKKKKKKTKKEIKITWSSPNYHGSYPMNNAENNVWNYFKEHDTAGPKTDMPVRVGKHFNTVGKDDMVVDLLGKFAVDTFNRSCQMYVNNDEENQISGAEFMECKFSRLNKEYVFYMTIEAIEQGIPGVYETRVQCGAEDGAKTLMVFKLTDREPKWNRPWVKPCRKPKVEYETVQGGSSDPQDFYELTGMVHRPTEGGGFNYYNPPFATHRINFTSTKDEGAMAFVPNVRNPLQFPVATKTIPMDR